MTKAKAKPAKKPSTKRKVAAEKPDRMAFQAGAPTKYRPEFAAQAAKLCEFGATDYELAQFFGVRTGTIYEWRNRFPKFAEAVTIGKDAADTRVERSLFQRAVGYTFETEKVFHAMGQITRAEVVEHVPPDPGAALNWLKNRKPEVWRDKQIIAGPDDGPLQVIIQRFADDKGGK